LVSGELRKLFFRFCKIQTANGLSIALHLLRQQQFAVQSTAASCFLAATAHCSTALSGFKGTGICFLSN